MTPTTSTLSVPASSQRQASVAVSVTAALVTTLNTRHYHATRSPSLPTSQLSPCLPNNTVPPGAAFLLLERFDSVVCPGLSAELYSRLPPWCQAGRGLCCTARQQLMSRPSCCFREQHHFPCYVSVMLDYVVSVSLLVPYLDPVCSHLEPCVLQPNFLRLLAFTPCSRLPRPCPCRLPPRAAPSMALPYPSCPWRPRSSRSCTSPTIAVNTFSEP